MELPRVKSRIDGFDDVLGGGVPKGSVVIVTGMPGTMKSSLAYAILLNNARDDGAKCLYVSLEQTKSSLENQMEAMGFDMDLARRSIHILDVGTIQKDLGRSATKPWMEFLRRTVETKRRIDGVDLIVFDSLEALEVLARFSDRRSELFHFFQWLRDVGGTSFVLTEAPPEPSYLILDPGQARDDAGYLADGIVHLKLHPLSDVEMQRRVRVLKLRGSNHKTGFYALLFEGGRFSVTPAMSA
jgi:KaiC/GvpD/RAD55 family RecA-like ATPase